MERTTAERKQAKRDLSVDYITQIKERYFLARVSHEAIKLLSEKEEKAAQKTLVRFFIRRRLRELGFGREKESEHSLLLDTLAVYDHLRKDIKDAINEILKK